MAKPFYQYLQRSAAAVLAASLLLVLGCSEDHDADDSVLFELDITPGGVFDAAAYTGSAAADSLTGLWIMLAKYDYSVNDSAVGGAGRELFRSSVRIQDAAELSFANCYTGTPPQMPQLAVDGSFEFEFLGAIARVAPNAERNVLTGQFVRNAASIDFQGDITLIKLSTDSSVKLGTLRVTSAVLDEEALLDTDCFYETQQELDDRTGTRNPNEIKIPLSRNNLRLSDLYVEGSAVDQQLRSKALQTVNPGVTFEFLNPARSIGVNTASTSDIAISGSDISGLQATLGAAEGDQQATITIDIALP